MSCEECLKREKKMKIMLSDHEFELRKITEDKAEEKALFEINMLKQMRKWQDKYHKQKLDHEENSKKWLNKIDQSTATCQLKIKEIKQQAEKMIAQCQGDIRAKAESQRAELIKNYESKLKVMKENDLKEKNQMQQSYLRQLSSMEKRFTGELEKIKYQAREKEQTLTKQFECIIIGLRSEKAVEQKQNFRLQEEHKRERSRYLSQIYDHKSIISSLQTNVSELKGNLMVKSQELEQKKAEIVRLCNQHVLKLQEAESEKERLKLQWQKQLQDQLRRFYQKQLLITEKYQESVKSIEEKREEEKYLYKNNLLQIRTCMENRPSRMEDLEEILLLKEKLYKKEKEFEMLEKEARSIQLELENKEDTYNRIFIPSVNSTHLGDNCALKKKELKLKRPGKSLSSVRDILTAINVNSNNLPSLNSIDKKFLPPKTNKIL